MQRYTVTTLDGGERIVTERVSSVRSVAIGIWIGAGSRDETSGQEGVSHLIEHLLFKGSARYSAVEIAQIFDGLGGELNAATAKEYTVVYARVLDAHLETALDVMADMLLQPQFDPAEMGSERDVVLEEIAMYDDTPQDLVHDLIAPAVFADHPLGRPVIGSAEVVASATPTTSAPTTVALRRPEHRRLRRRQPRPRAARARDRDPVCAALAVPDHAAGVRPVWMGEARRDRSSRRRTPSSSTCASAAWASALRPAPVRGLAARLDARRLRQLAPLPGDPRTARDGLLGLHVRLPVRGHRPGRRLRGHARGQPGRVRPHHRRPVRADGRGPLRAGRAPGPRRT